MDASGRGGFDRVGRGEVAGVVQVGVGRGEVKGVIRVVNLQVHKMGKRD